jgi:hypothetical protein
VFGIFKVDELHLNPSIVGSGANMKPVPRLASKPTYRPVVSPSQLNLCPRPSIAGPLLDCVQSVDLLYRTLHDLGESPRTAFGGSASPNIAALAMQLDLDPILKKVRRKQLIRTVAYKKRAEMILRLTDLYAGTHYWPCRLQVHWAPVMPQDRARDAETDAILVDRGIISRRTAAAREGIEDADGDLNRWLEENERISRSGGLPRTAQAVEFRQAIEPE